MEHLTVNQQSENETSKRAHAEAVEFVNSNRDLFEHYARGAIAIEPAPEGLPTFAFDLEKNTIFINSMFFEDLGLSEEKTVFATLHEIEHLLEKLQILGETEGEKQFSHWFKKIKQSRAYALMDNCIADIRENRAVISKTNPGMGELEIKIYKDDLFPEIDLTDKPRHIQFCESLLRESRIPQEECAVAPEVRQNIEKMEKIAGLIEIMTDPDTPMSLRLRLQDKYILPVVEELLAKDIEERKKLESEKTGEGGETQASDASGDKSQEANGDEGEETDPNKIFASEYEEAEKKFPQAVPLEEVEREFNKWKKAQHEKNSSDQADEELARKIGVEKTYLQEYRKVVQELSAIVSPETDIGILEELRDLFNRIIAKRLKETLAPKYPVEEGDELVDPALLVSEVSAGNLQPKVWEDTKIVPKTGDRFGEVEITLVCDRSASMDEGQKASQQQKTAVLLMEVLKDFADICDEEKTNVDKPLEVRSEIYSFENSETDKIPLKKMSKELGEAERINIYKKLHHLPGSTTDFNCLEAIDANLNEESKAKINSGELKKIVFALTDGESDDPLRVQAVLRNLRQNGVIVVGIGMTDAGSAVLTTYAPVAQVVADVSKLPFVLADLLKEHLKDL